MDLAAVRTRRAAMVAALALASSSLAFATSTTAGAQNECHPDYSGCLPVVSDMDCQGGGGNGPYYVASIVRVLVPGQDEYGLDRENDGRGCENPRYGLSAHGDGELAKISPEIPGRGVTPTTTTTTTTTTSTTTTTAAPSPTVTPTTTMVAPTTTVPTTTTTRPPAPAPTPPASSAPVAAPSQADTRGAGSSQHASSFATHLSGSRQVPSMPGQGLGWSTWRVSDDGSRIDYRVIHRGVGQVLAMHLHQAHDDRNGPVIVPLDVSGTRPFGGSGDRIIEGSFTVEDFVGRFDGRLMAGLLGAIESGAVYVNVHTAEHPAGAIRGQLAVWR